MDRLRRRLVHRNDGRGVPRPLRGNRVTPDQAKEHNDAQDAKLRALEAEVSRLAEVSSPHVVVAVMRVLVEMVCGAQGPNFVRLNKIKFYEGVLGLLRDKGIT